jgi:hypothetical protein
MYILINIYVYTYIPTRLDEIYHTLEQESTGAYIYSYVIQSLVKKQNQAYYGHRTGDSADRHTGT